MIRRHDLHFSMPCPYLDPETDEECKATIHVRAWPGRPASWNDPSDPSGWEAWGCPHVEEGMAEEEKYRIERKIDDRLEDLEARARGDY